MVTRMNPAEVSRFGNHKKIRGVFDAQQADVEYLREHYSELLSKYRNHWIIIDKGKVIAVESDPTLLRKALNTVEDKDVLVYFLADPEEEMLL